jgi:DNA-binding NarL/FixJ family response regulator
MNSDTVARVMLVDDDPAVRTGLRLILGSEPDVVIVGEARDGFEADVVARHTIPDVVLIDIRLPVQVRVTTAEHLLRLAVPPLVIMFTTVIGAPIDDGAPHALIAAIRSGLAGEPVTVATVERTKRDRARGTLGALTARELQVAKYLSLGLSDGEIALHQFVSVATVTATVTRILLKLETDNRVSVATHVRDAEL